MLGDVANEFEVKGQTKRKHRKTHGKVGFAQMAKEISTKWKALDKCERKVFEDQASAEKERYVKAMSIWRKGMAEAARKMKAAKERRAPVLHDQDAKMNKIDTQVNK